MGCTWYCGVECHCVYSYLGLQQIWEMATGKPIYHGRDEFCSASVMMASGDKVLLGRTDRIGGGSHLRVFDIGAQVRQFVSLHEHHREYHIYHR